MITIPLKTGRLAITLGMTVFFSSMATAEGSHLFILSGQSNMAGLKPEESFTPTVQDRFGSEQVIVVKVAVGGQPIRRWDKGWELGEGDQPNRIGDLYAKLMGAVATATKDKTLDSVTFLWMQGEKDAREQHGAVYADSFHRLLKQLSTDLKRDDINYVIGRLSDFDMKDAKYPDWTKMRDVLVELADASPRGAWVDTDDLNDGKNRKGKMVKDDLHYSADGYVTFGKRLATSAIELIEKHSDH